MDPIRVVAAVWIRDGRVLAAERGPQQSNPGAWELPGGKVEPGESDREALRRELTEELGLDAIVGARVGPVSRLGRIELVAYLIDAGDTEPVPSEHATLRWLDRDALWSVGWAVADLPLVAAIEDHLRGRPG
jgi:8-oxo-dGTP diphosphatase